MIVFKLGGSVYHTEYLHSWLNAISSMRDSVVVVPGGGVFADQVRQASQQYSLSEQTGHKMALLAMQQYGELLCGLNSRYAMTDIKGIENTFANDRIPVWSVYEDSCRWFEGPQTWESSSDSLSLWFATRIQGSCLCLIKSAPIDRKLNLHQLVQSDILDKQFTNLVDDYAGGIKLLNVFDFELLKTENGLERIASVN